MNWSLGETRALAVKAARGAGMDWGLADDAGFAVHWLEAHGAPAATALANLLDWYDRRGGNSAADRESGVCPVILGTAMSDCRAVADRSPGIIVQPLLLAPFVMIADPHQTWSLKWNDVDLRISQQGLKTDAQHHHLLDDAANCRLEPVGAFEAGHGQSRVPDTESEAISRLGIFAARTYAPATEQSRMAGAGAGLNDND